MPFSILNTARQGLFAAQAGIDVTGQNVANVNSHGYTRQRVEQSAAAPLREMGLGRVTQTSNGQGVNISGVARLGDAILEGRVRQTASNAGYATVRAQAYGRVEDIHAEPSDTALSAVLESFWSAWQELANNPGKDAQGWVVIEAGNQVADAIASGRAQVEDAWDSSRRSAANLVAELNGLADKVAALNDQIRSAAAHGTSLNELVDQRNVFAEKIAQIAGGKVSENSDGTVAVLIGGNPIVDGTRVNQVVLAGGTSLDSSTGDPVRLEWAHRPGSAVGLEGGELAGHISALAPAGSGGIYAAAADGYDRLATELANQLNALHAAANKTDGTPGGDFFTFAPGLSPARGLTVAVTQPSDIAVAAPGQGNLDGSVADQIASLALSDTGPDAVWAAFISQTAVASSGANYDASLARASHAVATNEMLSVGAVSLDEETVNLMQYQHAYQGSARVLTAVDEMLDTLINRTGLVGR